MSKRRDGAERPATPEKVSCWGKLCRRPRSRASLPLKRRTDGFPSSGLDEEAPWPDESMVARAEPESEPSAPSSVGTARRFGRGFGRTWSSAGSVRRRLAWEAGVRALAARVRDIASFDKRVLQQAFFVQVFEGRRLRETPAVTVAAAMYDLHYLSVDQLLFLREAHLDFAPSTGDRVGSCLENHAVFMKQLDFSLGRAFAADLPGSDEERFQAGVLFILATGFAALQRVPAVALVPHRGCTRVYFVDRAGRLDARPDGPVLCLRAHHAPGASGGADWLHWEKHRTGPGIELPALEEFTLNLHTEHAAELRGNIQKLAGDGALARLRRLSVEPLRAMRQVGRRVVERASHSNPRGRGPGGQKTQLEPA